jgi:hypothetical protein
MCAIYLQNKRNTCLLYKHVPFKDVILPVQLAALGLRYNGEVKLRRVMFTLDVISDKDISVNITTIQSVLKRRWLRSV